MEGVTSLLEWEFVVSPQSAQEYTERGGTFREEHPEWCRKPIKFKELDRHREQTYQHTPEGAWVHGDGHGGAAGRPAVHGADVLEVQQRASFFLCAGDRAPVTLERALLA
jgi:hypothetical protein